MPWPTLHRFWHDRLLNDCSSPLACVPPVAPPSCTSDVQVTQKCYTYLHIQGVDGLNPSLACDASWHFPGVMTPPLPPVPYETTYEVAYSGFSELGTTAGWSLTGRSAWSLMPSLPSMQRFHDTDNSAVVCRPSTYDLEPSTHICEQISTLAVLLQRYFVKFCLKGFLPQLPLR